MTSPPAGARAATPRVWFVDVVRLLASLQMVNGHTIDAVLLPGLKQGAVFDLYNWARGLVAVCFLLVAGMAYHLSTVPRHGHHAPMGAAGRRVRRALLVIAAGYAVAIPWSALEPDPVAAAAAWQAFYAVGILHTIGAALLVLEVVTRIARSSTERAMMCGALATLMLALAPVADGTLTPGAIDPLRNWISHAGGSPFPLLPWAGYVFAGVVAGAIALPQGAHTPQAVIQRRLAGLTLVVWASSALLARVPWTLVTAASHPATPPAFALQKLAAVLLLTLALSVACAAIVRLPALLRTLAGETLAIYVIHLVLLFSGGIAIATRIGPTLDLPRALLLSAVMVMVTAAAAIGWHRAKAAARRLMHARVWPAVPAGAR
ncbi:MAG: heparan-alpha-glucosaminide N-acetyltransferase domain-containing protein [Vicinamibacterales bacterium]